MKMFLLKQWKYGEIFKNHSADQIDNISNIVTREKVNIETLITTASGQFSSSLLLEHSKTRCQFFFKWMFSLDINLALNLTFLTVNFTTYFTDCEDGKLYILYEGHKFSQYYCGKQPLFYHFTSFNVVDIMCEVKAFIVHVIKVSFTVHDKHLVESMKHEDLSDYPGLENGWFLKSRTLMLLYYFMQVAKDKLLLGEVSRMGLQLLVSVHNGPGILSDKLKLQRGNFKASTFQCVVVLLNLDFSKSSSKHFFLDSARSHLDFSSKSRHVPKIQLTNHSMFTFHTSSFCAARFCLVNVKASHDEQVNVTVTSVLFSGEETQNCSNGGLPLVTHLAIRKAQIIKLSAKHLRRKSKAKAFIHPVPA